jgi:hypothetical protein
MADRDTNAERSRDYRVREPRPEEAAQDPQAAARQVQVARESDEMRACARRVHASTPPAARDRTVQEMTRDAGDGSDRTPDRGQR